MSCAHEWLEEEETIECAQCGAVQTEGIDETYDTLAEWRG